MFVFFFYTLLIFFAAGCFTWVAFTIIQEEQLFDMIFGWQDMLTRLYDSGKNGKRALGKILGDCQMCFSHFIAFICFWFYYFLSKTVLHFWITNVIHIKNKFLYWLCVCVANIGWYITFASIATFIGLVFIVKILSDEKEKPNKDHGMLRPGHNL